MKKGMKKEVILNPCLCFEGYYDYIEVNGKEIVFVLVDYYKTYKYRFKLNNA